MLAYSVQAAAMKAEPNSNPMAIPVINRLPIRAQAARIQRFQQLGTARRSMPRFWTLYVPL